MLQKVKNCVETKMDLQRRIKTLWKKLVFKQKGDVTMLKLTIETVVLVYRFSSI